jgi:cytochrome P450 family 4
VDNVIMSRREELMKSGKSLDLNENDIGAKKKMAFLDILLKSTIDGEPLSNQDIQEEVKTFLFGGHDTIACSVSFCLYNLAKYPEIQTKAFEEVRNLMGDDPNKPTILSDLNSMNYLEMVIKESLRLFQTGPFFGRKVEENIEISKTILSEIFHDQELFFVREFN